MPDAIAPDDVVAAYRALPYQPDRRTFFTPAYGTFPAGCCGLAALAAAQGADLAALTAPGVHTTERLAALLGLSADYLHGFIGGWDWPSETPLPAAAPDEERQRGFEAGRAALRAVRDAFPDSLLAHSADVAHWLGDAA